MRIVCAPMPPAPPVTMTVLGPPSARWKGEAIVIGIFLQRSIFAICNTQMEKMGKCANLKGGRATGKILTMGIHRLGSDSPYPISRSLRYQALGLAHIPAERIPSVSKRRGERLLSEGWRWGSFTPLRSHFGRAHGTVPRVHRSLAPSHAWKPTSENLSTSFQGIMSSYTVTTKSTRQTAKRHDGGERHPKRPDR